MSADSGDEEIQLSDETKKALAEFYADQQKAESSNEITENWQLSQFWYTDDTSIRLAKECIAACLQEAEENESRRIACVSCPSVMEKLLECEEVISGRIVPFLFEYDTRFAAKYGDSFSFFDYNNQDMIDPKLIASFHLVIADPPFLSDECQLKTAVFARRLLRQNGNTKLILCTGATMETMAEKAFNARRSVFKPEHRNNLANEFACYTSYKPVTFE
uniref:Protein-lysine N-methyltransferase n=1 Tax=Panagrolaimus superbus TaxID=310955 RepID=A0A914Y133_9BILA